MGPKAKVIEDSLEPVDMSHAPVEWLRPTVVVDSRASAFRRLAPSLRRRNPVETIRAILEWIESDYRKAGVGPDLPASKTLERGSGECASNSMVFVGLCQACDVPARVVQGLVLDAPTLFRTLVIEVGSGLAWVLLALASPIRIQVTIPIEHLRATSFGPEPDRESCLFRLFELRLDADHLGPK